MENKFLVLGGLFLIAVILLAGLFVYLGFGGDYTGQFGRRAEIATGVAGPLYDTYHRTGETECWDMEDDDNDGYIDCADADCNQKSCGQGCLCIQEAVIFETSFDITPTNEDYRGVGWWDMPDLLWEICGYLPGQITYSNGETSTSGTAIARGFCKCKGALDIYDPEKCIRIDTRGSSRSRPELVIDNCNMREGNSRRFKGFVDRVQCLWGRAMETNCVDGQDNDGDEKIDNADRDCQRLSAGDIASNAMVVIQEELVREQTKENIKHTITSVKEMTN